MKIARFQDMPLRRKLRVLNLVTVSLSFLVLMIALSWHTWTTSYQEAIDEGVTRAQVLASNAEAALMFKDAAAATETLSSLRYAPEVEAAVIFDGQGKRFAYFARPGEREEPVPERLTYAEGVKVDGDHLDIVVPIESDAGKVGTLQMICDLGPIFHRIWAFAGILAGTAMAALLLGTSLLNRLQGTITRRIANLAALMQQVSLRKDYSRRADSADGRDEISSLAESFNKMLEQIQLRDGELGNELDQRRHAEKKLQKLAHYDPLTHLPNRHYFNLHLQEKFLALDTMEGNVGLMFIDLDNFKYVNDTFGHQTGDVLLVTVAQRLRDALRSGDLICRLGGDEFAVVLTHVGHADQIEAIAQKMIDAVSMPFAIEGNEVFVGASIGIAMAPEHAQDDASLVRHADAAMYKAKQAGKNGYMTWHAEFGEQVTRRYQLESGLRKARAQGELSLYYQPIHDLASGQVLGVEALLRWLHPQLGPISPDEFIHIAEESGQIDAIGYWVIEEASRQAAIWHQRHPGLFVAVNLSSRQFADERLADRIADLIGGHGCSPRLIELEVTESLLLDASPRVRKTLDRLNELGFALVLDDFGTGYSSLAYLSRYPFSKLKIDRGFIMELGQGASKAGIIQAIVAMGNSMSMTVVAEGIETAAQRAWLVSIGCQVGQGYHFSRPQNSEVISSQLADMPPIGCAPSHLKPVG